MATLTRMQDYPPSRASLRALDCLTGLVAASQTAFGPLLAAALAERGRIA
jgi:hypothetical protein